MQQTSTTHYANTKPMIMIASKRIKPNKLWKYHVHIWQPGGKIRLTLTKLSIKSMNNIVFKEKPLRWKKIKGDNRRSLFVVPTDMYYMYWNSQRRYDCWCLEIFQNLPQKNWRNHTIIWLVWMQNAVQRYSPIERSFMCLFWWNEYHMKPSLVDEHKYIRTFVLCLTCRTMIGYKQSRS